MADVPLLKTTPTGIVHMFSCRPLLISEQRAIDREARLVVSRELGHERESVTGAYRSVVAE